VEYAIEFGGDPQDVTITMSGPADAATFLRLTHELVSHPNFRPRLAMLVDISAVDTPLTSEQDTEEATQAALERDWNFPPRAVAIVVSTPHFYELTGRGVAHMGGILEAPREVFYSREEALAWLREQKSLEG
jgi:hypothetical protein